MTSFIANLIKNMHLNRKTNPIELPQTSLQSAIVSDDVTMKFLELTESLLG